MDVLEANEKDSIEESNFEMQKEKSSSLCHEIDRFGLYGLAGDLCRTGPDPLTVQMLEEIKFLPRQVMRMEDAEDPLRLRSQDSLPALSMVPQEEKQSSETLGLNSLKISPMKLNGVYGRSAQLPVLNFTGIHKSHIVYAASNVLVFFDYYKNSQSILQGHKNQISCLTRDRDTKFLATGDVGKDCAVIIWNVHTGFPVKTISPTQGRDGTGVGSIGFGGSGLSILGILQSERVDVVEMKVGQSEQSAEKSQGTVDQQSVSIWFVGDLIHKHHQHHEPLPSNYNEAEAILEIPLKVGLQRDLDFSADNPHQFITTGDKYVVFYTWLHSEKKIIYHLNERRHRFLSRCKVFTQSIWVKDSVFTATSSGYIVEWKLQPAMGLEDAPDSKLNIKDFRRLIKIDEFLALTALVAYKEFIVVGDERGSVRFLDAKFRLLRWTKTERGQMINSLSFNMMDTPPEWKTEMRRTYEAGGYDHNVAHRNANSTVYDYTYGGTRRGNEPSETTLERESLHPPGQCVDVIVGHTSGEVSYFHIDEGKVDVIVNPTPGLIIALDASPTTTHFVLTTKTGEIQMLDYKTKEMIFSQKIFKKKLIVTTLKFHPSGAYFVIGTEKGTIYFRRSFTCGLMDNPLHTGNDAILKIVFSSCGLFMGIFDCTMTVTLCNFNCRRSVWSIKGKHRSHYRPVVDINFLYDRSVGHQRFFSLGQDRRLVEYDIQKSTPTIGLSILNAIFVEQIHIPTSFVFDTPFPKHGPIFMYANTNNKIRMFDQDACKIRKTCQGPEYGAPINRMISITPEAKRGASKRYILMILGKLIGLMKTPVDGNPFKYMAVLGHHTNILDVGVGSKGRDILTCAENDNCVFMWNPESIVLDKCALSGGSGITPYKHYLNVGLSPKRNLVADIETIFYHLMMKRAENKDELLSMNLQIPLEEIPTAMRICGYFPTELEIDMLLEEVEFLLVLKYNKKETEIGFEDFLMLYANHKDSGVHHDDVIRAFKVLGEYNEVDDLCIPRENFVSLITRKGEALNELDLPHFLPNFYKPIYKGENLKKQKSWYLKSSAQSLVSLPRGSVSTKSTMSPNTKKSLSPIESKPSSLSPTKDTISYRSSRFTRSSIRYDQSTRPSQFQMDYDNDQLTKTRLQLPNDITANFFIRQLLPEDVHSTLFFDRNEFIDDINDLERLSERSPPESPINEILRRWKGRDEWRYFKEIFEVLKHEHIPIDLKLQAVIEMDNFCRTGKWPKDDVSPQVGEEFEESVHDNDSDLPLSPTQITLLNSPKRSPGIIKSSKSSSPNESDDRETRHKRMSVKFVDERKEKDGNDVEFDLMLLNIDGDEKSSGEEASLGSRPLLVETETEERESQSSISEMSSYFGDAETGDEESDVTIGNRDTPPFSNLPDSDAEYTNEYFINENGP